MKLNHFFDFYTIRVRKYKSSSYELLHSIGEEKYDLYAIISMFVQGIEEFADDEINKLVAIKDEFKSDDKEKAIFGRLKSGAYGVGSEIVDRKTKEVIVLSEDQAKVYNFFLHFQVSKNSTTGALVIHRIGGESVYSQVKKLLLTFFRDICKGYVLEIEPIFFNIQNKKDGIIKKLGVVLSTKKTEKEKVITGSISPRTEEIGRFILEVGKGPNVLGQLLSADNLNKTIIDKVSPFMQAKALESYDVSFSAVVEVNGRNKALNISKEFRYSTSVDVTTNLTIKNGVPTTESLLEQSKDSLKLLKAKNKI